jgi:hypothetical protein
LFPKVVNKAFCGPVLNFDINGCFFSIESVLYDSPPGGSIDIILSLLLNGALEGELELCCADFKGDCLLTPAWGGFKTIFLLDAAFFIGRSGDFSVLEVLCAEGIGAWSKEVIGSWYICTGCCE